MTAEELRECHAIVWQWRAKLADVWPTPNRQDALRFAVTEAAEAMDAWLRLNGGYARNHDKNLSVEDELADCAMMLLTAAGENSQPVASFRFHEPKLEWIMFYVARLCYDNLIDSDSQMNNSPGDIVAMIAAYPGMGNLAQRINGRLERIAERRLTTWQQ